MNRPLTLLLCLGGLLALAASEGALLGFQRAVPGYSLAFPVDHAAHPAYQTEWWYYTGHLRAPGGKTYGYQLTFFRHRLDSSGPTLNPSKWFADNLYMAHMAITDEQGRRVLQVISRAADLAPSEGALDESVQEIGRRLGEQARDRSRMEAILAGMVEGVIVVDAQGRLELVNAASRQMLRLETVAVGRPYLETIRLPSIAELVAAVLDGRATKAVQPGWLRRSIRLAAFQAGPNSGACSRASSSA